jgi:pimeloyl-ACP methyl ester carboxylesterase
MKKIAYPKTHSQKERDMTSQPKSPQKYPLSFKISSLFLLISLLCMGFPNGVSADEPPIWPEECQVGSLPGNDPDYPQAQITLTCLPQPWNGYLVVYAHGYVAPQKELALPVEELGQARLPDGQSIIDILLSLGFAFATTSYHKNGYAPEQAVPDINALVDYFNTQVAPHPADKVLITGASEGGLVTTMLLERFAGRYSGGLAMCGPVGGAPYQLDYVGDFRVVFDYFFPDVFPFGAADVPENAYLDWESVYAPAIEKAILGSASKRLQLFIITKAPWVPGEPETAVVTAHTLLRYSVVGTNDLKQLAGGVMPYNNIGRKYRGSFNDPRLNKKVERVAGDTSYLYDYYQTTGRLEIPLVTLHTLIDGAVPFRHELIYLDRVKNVGRSHYLTVLPVVRDGHCNFKPEEVLGAFALLFLQVGLKEADALMPYIQSLPEPLQ